MIKRIIKFRAWDTKKKIMIQLVLEGQYRDTDEDTGSGSITLAFESDYVSMQFTGLLDKNGKEIYEGDIVQLSINDELPSHKGTVEYLAPKFFVMDGEKSGLLLTDQYEVIGNTCETPDLLSTPKPTGI